MALQADIRTKRTILNLSFFLFPKTAFFLVPIRKKCYGFCLSMSLNSVETPQALVTALFKPRYKVF